MAKTRTQPMAVKRFVLDCSVALAWYFADEADPYADAVAAALAGATIVVPALFHLEIANILVAGERRKRSTEAEASAFLGRLASLRIEVDGQTIGRAWPDIIAIARAHGLSTYDAAYLELAARETLPLATLDAQLQSAANAVGVSSFSP
jgi:predicted nucleic acid-binding protein